MLLDPHPAPSVADAVAPVRVYERSAFEERLAEIEEERDRLIEALAAAEARRDALQQVQVPTPAEQVGAVVLRAQAALTTEWDDCRSDDAALAQATDTVVSWILAGAQDRAETLRNLAARIRMERHGDGPGDVGEDWWQGVIDLTKADHSESAHSA